MHTVGEDKSREGKVEDNTELLPRCAVEFRVDLVLNHPHNKAGKEEEGKACDPEGSCEWLQEDPHAPARFFLHYHDH